MIVLAIAGLILAIVFIAVPALQRNARDTQRRADISAISGAIATYSGNNSGAVPDNAAKMVTALDGIDLAFYDQTVVAAAASVPVGKTLVVGETFAPRGGTATTTDPSALSVTEAEVLIDGAVLIPEGECAGATVAKATALTVSQGTTPNITGWEGLLSHGSVRSYAIVYALESDPNIVCIDNI